MSWLIEASRSFPACTGCITRNVKVKNLVNNIIKNICGLHYLNIFDKCV